MLHGRNKENILHMKELLFPWEKESFVPATQHGCRAKPLLSSPQKVIGKAMIQGLRKLMIGNTGPFC